MAVSPVVIRFLADGVPNVQRAVRSILDVVAQTERAATAVASRETSRRVRVAEGEARDRIRSAVRSETMANAARRAGNREVENQARGEARAARQVANERISQLQRVVNEERRLRAQLLRDKITSSNIPFAPSTMTIPKRGANHQFLTRDAGERLALSRAEANVMALHEMAGQKRSSAEQARADKREADRRARDAEREGDRAAREKDKTRKAELAAELKHNREQERLWERSKANLQRDADRADRRLLRMQDRSANEMGRRAKKAADTEIREAERGARESARAHGRVLRTLGGAAGRGIGNALSAGAGAVRSVVGGALSLGGGLSVEGAIKERMDLDREAVMFSNAAFQNRPGEKRIDAAKITGQTHATAVKVGMDPAELLQGASSYGAKTGEYQEGLDLQEFFGKVAKGTGASVADVAKTAGMLRVQNEDLSPDAMKKLILNTIRQGQVGSVEFSDLAHVAGAATKTATAFAGSQEGNQSKLLGIAQLAMKTSKSPEEAATAIANLSSDARKHAEDIKAATKTNYLNEHGQINMAPEEFIASLMRKTGGNLAKIQEMGFGERSQKLFLAMQPTFLKAQEKAEKEKKGSGAAAGEAAVLKEFAKVTGASMSVEELETNVANIMKTSAETFEQTVRLMKAELADKLLPEVQKLTPEFIKLVPLLRDFLRSLIDAINWFHEHPWKGLGIVVGASMAKEMGPAIAGIGLKALFEKAFAALNKVNAPNIGGPSGGGGKLGGQLAGATGVALTGVAVAGATYEAIQLAGKEDADMQSRNAAAELALANAKSDLNLREGEEMTPDRILSGENAANAMRAAIARREQNIGGDTTSRALGKAGALAGGAGTYLEYQKAQAEREKIDKEVIERNKKELADFTAALEAARKAAKEYADQQSQQFGPPPPPDMGKRGPGGSAASPGRSGRG